MAGAPGIRAGRAFVEMFISDNTVVGLRRIQRQLRGFSTNIRALGQDMLRVSTAAVAPLAISATVFAGFEQEMARVRALTGATGDDFDRLSKKAKRLGETTVFTARQSARAMGFFALAGFDVDKILKAIEPTLDLAAAGQMDVAVAADIVAKIMAGMGIEAANVGEAVDVMTAAFTSANTDLVQLGDAMKFVGPIAKSAGIRFEEIVAAVQLLSNAGIQGEMAGTTLRGMLLALTSPSREAEDALRDLGVAVSDENGNVRSLADIVEDLGASLDGLGTGGRLKALGTIFRQRQAAGAAELLGQGADRLREFTGQLENAGGTAARVANTQLDTLRGDAIILVSALEGLAIAIGEAMVGPLRVAARTIRAVTSATTAWVRQNRDLVIIATAAILGLGGISVAMIALGIAGAVAAGVMSGLGTLFGLAAAAAAALVSPLGILLTALGGITVWTGVAGEVLRWLGERFGRLRETVATVLDGIKDAMAGGDFRLAAEVLFAGLLVVWEQGVAALSQTWLKMKEFFVETALAAWTETLVLAQTVWHALEVGWINTTSFMSKTWTNFIADMQSAWGVIHAWLTKRWLGLMQLFGQLTGAQADAARAAVDEDFADFAGDIERRRRGRIDEAERRRRERRAEADAIHEGAVARLGQQFAEARDALRAGTVEGVAEAQKQLERAQAALAGVRENAARVAAGGEDGPQGDVARVVKNVADRLRGLIAGPDGPRGGTAGTFNAAAIRGALGGNTLSRVAVATEKAEKRLAAIQVELERGGAVFVEGK